MCLTENHRSMHPARRFETNVPTAACRQLSGYKVTIRGELATAGRLLTAWEDDLCCVAKNLFMALRSICVKTSVSLSMAKSMRSPTATKRLVGQRAL
jgi:hypothetical protein